MSTWKLHNVVAILYYIVQCYIMLCTNYISSEQDAFCGFSSLCPVCSTFNRPMAGIPGYGILPQVNISQTVTPNDHYNMYRKLRGILKIQCILTTSVLSLYISFSILSGAIHLMGTISSPATLFLRRK